MRNIRGFRSASNSRWDRLGFALAVFAGASLSLAKDISLEVSAGPKDLPAGPIVFHADSPLPNGPLTLRGAGKTSGIAGQTDGKDRLAWWNPAMKAGEKITYSLLPGKSDADAQGVKVEEAGPGLLKVSIDGHPLTELHFGESDAKPYLYPVIGPTGDPVMRDFPMKTNPLESTKHIYLTEPHHKSFWTGFGDIRTHDFDKMGSNHWGDALQKGDGPVRVRKIVRASSGPVYGQIVADLDWADNKGTHELTEERTYTFYRSDDDLRVIDAKIVFHFDASDVKFGDCKEGGIIAIRLAVTMDEMGAGDQHGEMCNSLGQKGEKECWGKPADWCDYVGPLNGKQVGIAILDAPTNFRHPTPWHIRAYGLLAANPFALAHYANDKSKDGSYTWKKGESVEFNYRVIIHKGDTKQARIADQYTLYASPPKITLQ